MKKEIPEKTIQRLLIYYRYLVFLLQQGTKTISSQNFARMLEIGDAQLRKDLSYFGRLGRRGSGYDVLALKSSIAEILQIGAKKNVCIIGMGNLGVALAAYRGFELLGFNIAAVFDNAAPKIGHKIKGHVCRDIVDLAKIVKGEKIEVAILTVPAEIAQETALKLEAAGIRAILNFTPIKLSLSKKVKVRNIDLAQELKTLSFFMN